MKKDYKVTFTVVSTHSYTVQDCNSPEEAESIAETYFADGEDGTIEEQDIQETDVVEDDESKDS